MNKFSSLISLLAVLFLPLFAGCGGGSGGGSSGGGSGGPSFNDPAHFLVLPGVMEAIEETEDAGYPLILFEQEDMSFPFIEGDYEYTGTQVLPDYGEISPGTLSWTNQTVNGFIETSFEDYLSFASGVSSIGEIIRGNGNLFTVYSLIDVKADLGGGAIGHAEVAVIFDGEVDEVHYDGTIDATLVSVITKNFTPQYWEVEGATQLITFTPLTSSNSTVQFSVASSSVDEDEYVHQIHVTCSNTLSGDVECDLVDSGTGSATPGYDYAHVPTYHFNFAAGSPDPITLPFNLYIYDDSVDESAETVRLSLTNLSGDAVFGSNAEHTVSIIDDDNTDQAVVEFTVTSSSVSEDVFEHLVEITCSNTLNGEVQCHLVDAETGTATPGLDYIGFSNQLVIFPGGSSTPVTRPFILWLYDDALVESTETVDVFLTNLSGDAVFGSNTEHTVSILDNDGGSGDIVKDEQKISATQGGFSGQLGVGDRFGSSVTSIGDLNNDGITDLAVGAHRDEDGGYNRGAVWVLFMNSNGTVKYEQKISDTQGGFSGQLDNSDLFGSSVTSIGDLNNDGITDLAVGAPEDDDGYDTAGAIWILFMNSNGTVNYHQKISNLDGGLSGLLHAGDLFGISATSIGDLNNDGIPDLAVGAWGDDDGDYNRGAVWVLFMNSNGTVKYEQKISDTQGGFSGQLDNVDLFGGSVASLGDLNNDGITDLAVGAPGNDDGASYKGFGAVWILFLNSNGTVKYEQKISDTQGGFSGQLDQYDYFGGSVASLGDLNNDGTTALAAGAPRDDDGYGDAGAAWILFLNSNGTVKHEQKINATYGGFSGKLDYEDEFGYCAAPIGDLNNDGITDLAVGAHKDDDGNGDAGAVWILFLEPTQGPLGDGESDSEESGLEGFNLGLYLKSAISR
jgi:FG-GAP repeat/Calx-beta domain